MALHSFFGNAPLIPKDAIFALTAEYNRDESSLKVNLGQGVYRDENGSPWILPSVAAARQRVGNQKLDHEYLPILGLAAFRSAACELALGSDSLAIRQHRVGAEGVP